MERALFASSLSTATDSEAAVAETTAEIAAGLGGETPDLIVAFVSHHHGDAIEQLGPVLAARSRARAVLGCTGESIVGREQEVEKGPALSLWAGVLPNTKLRPFTVEVVQQEDGTFAFSRLPVVRDTGRASLLMFADPFAFPMSDYLEVLNQKLPGVPAVGGMASGGIVGMFVGATVLALGYQIFMGWVATNPDSEPGHRNTTRATRAMPGQSLKTMPDTRTVRLAVFTAAACPENPKRLRSLTFSSHVLTLD